MKDAITKLLLTALIAVFGVNANAQTQKGYAMVGTNLSSFDIGLKSGSNIKFDLTPKAGIFIKDGLLVGINALLGIEHVGGDDNGNIVDYEIGLFGRYYIANKNIEVVKHGKFFFEIDAGFHGRNQTKGGNKTNGLGIGFGPGFAYFLNSNVAIETSAKYQAIAGFGDTAYQHDLVWSLGLQVYLPYKSTKNTIVSDFK